MVSTRSAALRHEIDELKFKLELSKKETEHVMGWYMYEARRAFIRDVCHVLVTLILLIKMFVIR